MENSEEKKQNNRKEDERRDQDSGDNATANEKEWDPEREDEKVSPKEKLKKLRGVRIPTK